MPRFKSCFFTSAIALSTIASPVLANDMWSKVGPWEIRVDSSSGSCFMAGSYPNPFTYLRVGVNNVTHTSYMMIGAPTWTSLEAGKVYPLDAQFNGEAPEHWKAIAIHVGAPDSGLNALEVDFSTPSPDEAMRIWGQRLGFRLSFQGRVIANLKLNGTAAAAIETMTCNQSQLNTAGTSVPKADPFAAPPATAGSAPSPAPKPSPTPKPDDPFAA